MTSQGSPYGRFRRSLDRGLVGPALEAAGELGRVSLADALELCELLARSGDDRFGAASRRWLIRFIDETGASIAEVLMAGAALSELSDQPDSEVAQDMLERLLQRNE